VRELSISTERDRDHILVAVRDSGPGIDPAHSERVFEAFYTTKSSGVGMGLSICRSIIMPMGADCGRRRTSPGVLHFGSSCPARKGSPLRRGHDPPALHGRVVDRRQSCFWRS
jgi:K+-sensing histidine kinase KdpD